MRIIEPGTISQVEAGTPQSFTRGSAEGAQWCVRRATYCLSHGPKRAEAITGTGGMFREWKQTHEHAMRDKWCRRAAEGQRSTNALRQEGPAYLVEHGQRPTGVIGARSACAWFSIGPSHVERPFWTFCNTWYTQMNQLWPVSLGAFSRCLTSEGFNWLPAWKATPHGLRKIEATQRSPQEPRPWRHKARGT